VTSSELTRKIDPFTMEIHNNANGVHPRSLGQFLISLGKLVTAHLSPSAVLPPCPEALALVLMFSDCHSVFDLFLARVLLPTIVER
jgi:hypothetical protein